MQALNERDRKLLDLLAKYQVLSSCLLKQSFFAHTAATNFFRRIRQLEKAKLIKRLGPLSDHSYAWTLDDRGKNLCGIEETEFFLNRATLEHDVIVAHVRMVLERFKIGNSFTPERLLRKEAKHKNNYHWRREDTIIVPDGMFQATIKQQERMLSLEVELSFKNRRRYFDLFRRYHETYDPVFLIWYLVRTKSMGERIQALWNKYCKDNSDKYSRKIHFMFTEVDSFLNDPSTAEFQIGNEVNKLSEIWPQLRKQNDHTADQSLDQSVITPMIEEIVGEKCA
jgi:Replication-relaxation